MARLIAPYVQILTIEEKMETNLQNALSDILISVLSAKDFILAELPDVIHQLLLWKFWGSIICSFATLCVLMISCIYLYKYSKKHKIKIFRDEDGLYVCSWVLLLIWSVISVIWFLKTFNIDWLQILIAPKVYLIEYSAKLIQ